MIKVQRTNRIGGMQDNEQGQPYYSGLVKYQQSGPRLLRAMLKNSCIDRAGSIGFKSFH